MYYIKYGDGYLAEGRPYETLYSLAYSVAMIIELQIKPSNKLHLQYLELVHTLADTMRHLKDDRYDGTILNSLRLIAAEYYITIEKEQLK